MDSGLADAYNNRGNVYREQGYPEAAIAEYSQAIELDSQYARAYLNRGSTYDGLGEAEAAVDDYMQYLRLSPADGEYVIDARQRIEALTGLEVIVTD